MKSQTHDTPVAFFIFNRPGSTSKVFREIARACPRRLLVVADGPRTPEESEKCVAVRAVVEQVDWDCEVLTNFADVNLGCKYRVSSGLDWVFTHCEEAIILEDDCLPHPDFFRFCAELLDRHRDDTRVSMITGSNFLHGRARTADSYYFSRYGHVWGWASWRRAWRNYDLEMECWPRLRGTPWLEETFGDKLAANYWRSTLDKTHSRQIDTWDYQWLLSSWAQNTLAVVPSVNLVSNIGFDTDATHTKTAVETMSYLPLQEMAFPLRHPRHMITNKADEHFIFTQTCPWAVPQPGAIPWLRRNLAPFLPGGVRKAISGVRKKIAPSGRRANPSGGTRRLERGPSLTSK